MRNNVLFVCEGIQQLASTIAMAKSLKKSGIACCLYYAQGYTENENRRIFTYVATDNRTIPGLLQHVGLVIFLTNESSPFCMVSNKIGFIAKRTGTPTVTVQHGWIQPGLNYSANLQKVGFSGQGADNSPALWQFSQVLTYLGPDGIGYPIGTPNIQTEIPNPDNVNVLISSNFNWNVYSRENIIGFLRAIMLLKQLFPFLNFKHRPHPAEKTQKTVTEMGISMETLGVKEGAWENIDQALTWSDIVISTPSTAVLDSYFKGIPTFIYEFDSFESALSEVKGITFKNGKELVSMIGSLLTDNLYSDPKFPPFKPEIFEKIVRKEMATATDFNMSEEDFILYINFCKS